MSQKKSLATQTDALAECQEKIAYRFKDPSLLLCALSHSSLKSEGKESNERMEFLGDAVLGLVISQELYERHPDFSEGDLTHVRSALVSRRTLAALARKMELGQFVLVGRGMSERKALPGSVLSNVMEAILAALYLDGGFAAVRQVIVNLLQEELSKADLTKEPRDYKSLLQQYTQRHIGAAPCYRVVEQSGPDHRKVFHVVAIIEGRSYGMGEGRNKKEAEQAAAQATLAQLLRCEGHTADLGKSIGERDNPASPKKAHGAVGKEHGRRPGVETDIDTGAPSSRSLAGRVRRALRKLLPGS